MQLFPKSLNMLPLVSAVASVAALVGVVGGFWYYASPSNLQVGYAPTQPVPYSHRLHAGQMGMDCRYCHANVEKAAHAQIPATQVCMGCHALVKPDSARLAPVQRSLIDAAARALVPGGRLVYAVCSTDAREAEGIVDPFLAAHPEFARETIPERYAPLVTVAGDVLVPPGIDGRDGFYIAVLHRA